MKKKGEWAEPGCEERTFQPEERGEPERSEKLQGTDPCNVNVIKTKKSEESFQIKEN